MVYGVERDEPIRRSGSKPRAISERLAELSQPTRTVLDEPGPETNRDPEAQGAPPGASGVRFGGGGEPVEATRTEPGGPAVVEVPGELDHPDDDSHVVDGELVERESITAEGAEVSAGFVTDDETSSSGTARAANAPEQAIARPGTPGTIEPSIDRPATLLELADVVQPVPSTPWPVGSFVAYGSGKRAHWNGEAWRSGEAPSSS